MRRYCGQPWWSTAGFKILAGSFSQVELGVELGVSSLKSLRTGVSRHRGQLPVVAGVATRLAGLGP